MFGFLRKLICKHKYSFLGSLDANYTASDGVKHAVGILFFECPKCGKRKIARSPDHCYQESMLEILELWKHRQLDIKFVKDSAADVTKIPKKS